MEEKINKLKSDQEFRICPVCGYKDGFHTMLKQKQKKRLQWLFICPSCHEIFDIGMEIDMPK